MKNTLKTFLVTRTVIAGEGISCEMQIPAANEIDALDKARDLFSHEEGVTAGYQVKRGKLV